MSVLMVVGKINSDIKKKITVTLRDASFFRWQSLFRSSSTLGFLGASALNSSLDYVIVKCLLFVQIYMSHH